MAYLNTNARTTKPTTNESFQPLGRMSALFGVFVGFVKRAEDVQRNGRLQVWIPEFGSAPEEEQGWITVNYCSPFAGATNVETISKTDIESFDKTQTSYGMWFVPPDINNQVLVMFVGGDSNRGIWIGSLYNQFMNNMVPGMAADAKNHQYPGKQIPVAEYNKWDTKVTQPDRAFHPYEETKFKGVGNQGLITDQGRGVTNSSARREAPSKVFGILTPGPAIDDTVSAQNIRRKGGSSFIMDDGTGSEYVQLATKTGAQIKIDETNGYVYVINRDGTSWIQMDQKGHIDIFSQFDVSIRAMRDLNFRADRNINMEAGQNVFIAAAKDTKLNGSKDIVYDINNVPKKFDVPWYQKTERGAGEGGNIVFEAQWDMHSTVVQNNLYVTTKAGKQEYNSKKNIDIFTDDNYNLKVTNNININAGQNISEKTPNIKIEATSSYGLKSPTITNEGAVKIKGTLDVTGNTGLGGTLGVTGTTTGANANFNTIRGFFPQINNGSGPNPGSNSGGFSPPSVNSPNTPTDPVTSALAEIKALTDAGDILPPIKSPYFKRGMQSWPTIVTRWPTYEPCPLHEQFKFSSTTGYTPKLNEGDKTYNGSGGAGNGATTSPPPNTTPGADNKVLPPPDTQDSIVAKDLNLKALECQLKIHEGVRYNVYLDSLGLPTAGIGHLLRSNEQQPVGTPISEDQVTRWFQSDSSTCIKDAQNFVGMDTWSDLDDNRKRALSDLAYNMGGARLGKFTTFRTAMQRKDFTAAGEALKNSKWFTQVGRRGPAIVSQIVNGVDPNGCDKKFPP